MERILKNCAGPDGEPDSALKKYFEALRQDILDHPEGFLPRETQPAQALSAALSGDAQHPETDTYLYDVNVFVDNSGNKGAPRSSKTTPPPPTCLAAWSASRKWARWSRISR